MAFLCSGLISEKVVFFANLSLRFVKLNMIYHDITPEQIRGLISHLLNERSSFLKSCEEEKPRSLLLNMTHHILFKTPCVWSFISNTFN